MNQFSPIYLYSNSLAFQLAGISIVSILLKVWGSQPLNLLLVRPLWPRTSSLRTCLTQVIWGKAQYKAIHIVISLRLASLLRFPNQVTQ